MRALSIRPPWAYAIAHLGKRVENRTWSTRYRGPLLIHASSTIVPSEYDELAAIVGYRIEPQTTPNGVFVAVAQLVDCVGAASLPPNPWICGPYAWVLDDVRPLERPVAARGRLGLWTPDPLPRRRQTAA